MEDLWYIHTDENGIETRNGIKGSNIFTARKRSCGKVMFLQVSVILFTGGVCLVPEGCLVWGEMPGPGGGCLVQRGASSWGVPGPGGAWSQRVSGSGGVWSQGGAWSQGVSGPGGMPGGDPPSDGYCWGRYASYWNAFL